MEFQIKRLDHHGIVAGVIKDLDLVKKIDERLQIDKNHQEEITPGEAIAGMVINGLGFASKPLSLTPTFFETKALEELFRPGMKAEHFNRHKLGKVLDKAHRYGCEQLFFEMASAACVQENVDLRFNSEDTTTLSVSGEYDCESDEQTITLTHGYSKDRRPDLKQLVQELLVSQDGGVPLMMKSWDGNAVDTTIFKSRAAALVMAFKQSTSPRYLIADSKLYTKDNAKNLQLLNFITRIPSSIKQEQTLITEATEKDDWHVMDKHHRYASHRILHNGIPQRWIVVHSAAAESRAQKRAAKAEKKEKEAMEKMLARLARQGFACQTDAIAALEKLTVNLAYHQLVNYKLVERAQYSSKGRPSKATPATSKTVYAIEGTIDLHDAKKVAYIKRKSCYVIGSNIGEDALSDEEIIRAYKRQNGSVENTGFRFLKDPLFFASSLFIKKPSRIMGLLMVMTLALLVYSIAQRRMRLFLAQQQMLLPNQINQPTQKPTLRWLFQLLEGIHVVIVKIEGMLKRVIEGEIGA